MILPGESLGRIREYPVGVDISTCTAVLNFRHADGIMFMRQADGHLSDLEGPVDDWSLNVAYLKEDEGGWSPGANAPGVPKITSGTSLTVAAPPVALARYDLRLPPCRRSTPSS